MPRRHDCSRRATETRSWSALRTPRLSIDDLESIEAENEQREDVVAAAFGALDGAIEQIDEEQPVRQSGQRIVQTFAP